MTNWYSIFYWMTLADGLKKFFDGASNCFTAFTIIFFIGFLITVIGSGVQVSINNIKTDEQEKNDPQVRGFKICRKYFSIAMYVSLALCIITWTGYVAIPSKKDALIIIAGGMVGNFITHDSSTKQIPSEVMTLLRDKIKEEIKNTDLKTLINPDTLTGKTKEELINIIKNQQNQ